VNWSFLITGPEGPILQQWTLLLDNIDGHEFARQCAGMLSLTSGQRYKVLDVVNETTKRKESNDEASAER
jgi:hypothetical protein